MCTRCLEACEWPCLTQTQSWELSVFHLSCETIHWNLQQKDTYYTKEEKWHYFARGLYSWQVLFYLEMIYRGAQGVPSMEVVSHRKGLTLQIPLYYYRPLRSRHICSCHTWEVSFHVRCSFLRGVLSGDVPLLGRCLFLGGVLSWNVSFLGRCNFLEMSLLVSVLS